MVRRLQKSRGGWFGLIPLLCVAASFAGYLVAGPSLGLFFWGFFVATFFVPAAVLAARDIKEALIRIASTTIAVGIIWLMAVFQTPDTLAQWGELMLVLASYGLAIGMIALIAARTHMGFPLAHSLAVLLGVAWLTCPLWLLPHVPKFSVGTTDFLIEIYPPLVANGVLTSESPWTEKSMAYQLTSLNQDVPVDLARRGWMCIAAHGGLGAVLLLFCARKRRPPAPIVIVKTVGHDFA
jgi:hypothetical protein